MLLLTIMLVKLLDKLRMPLTAAVLITSVMACSVEQDNGVAPRVSTQGAGFEAKPNVGLGETGLTPMLAVTRGRVTGDGCSSSSNNVNCVLFGRCKVPSFGRGLNLTYLEIQRDRSGKIVGGKRQRLIPKWPVWVA